MPLQYLVGVQHWHDMTLAVGPGVLIPRPETYRLVELAEQHLAQNEALAHAPWIDMGCGSGTHFAFGNAWSFDGCACRCLVRGDMPASRSKGRIVRMFAPRLVSCCSIHAGALACAIARLIRQKREDVANAAALPKQTRSKSCLPAVTAADVSAAALEYTRLNARRLGVEDVVDVRQSSWCQKLGHLTGACGGIVSNPPYIPHSKLAGLQSEVSRCESCSFSLGTSRICPLC